MAAFLLIRARLEPEGVGASRSTPLIVVISSRSKKIPIFLTYLPLIAAKELQRIQNPVRALLSSQHPSISTPPRDEQTSSISRRNTFAKQKSQDGPASFAPM